MKKMARKVLLSMWALIYYMVLGMVVVIGITVNMFRGISPKTSFEHLWYSFQIGKEEESN